MHWSKAQYNTVILNKKIKKNTMKNVSLFKINEIINYILKYRVNNVINNIKNFNRSYIK